MSDICVGRYLKQNRTQSDKVGMSGKMGRPIYHPKKEKERKKIHGKREKIWQFHVNFAMG